MYHTKMEDAKREANFLNRTFLCLPKSYLKLRIRKLESEWGFAVEDDDNHYTVLHNEFPSYKLFRSVLAHELIHQWQYYHKLTGTHDKIFFTWRKPFGKLGYRIEKEY